jgi:hypothetical protein
MSLSNSERQRKYRENKLSATGNHYRLQLIIDHKTHAELSNIILRNTRLNSENRLLNSPVTKQDIIAAAIHKYALELGVEFDSFS